jgi:hypothetical protein
MKQVGVCDQHNARRIGSAAEFEGLHHQPRLRVVQDGPAAQRLLNRCRQVGVAVSGIDLIYQAGEHARLPDQPLERPGQL